MSIIAPYLVLVELGNSASRLLKKPSVQKLLKWRLEKTEDVEKC